MPRTEAFGTPQTLLGKTLSDEFMGDVWDNQDGIKRSVTLTASTNFIAIEAVEISAANTLEIPATSSLEIITYAPFNPDASKQRISNPYKFSVYRTSAQSLGTAATRVGWDTKTYDTNNNFDLTNNRYVVPVHGFYQFNAHVNIPTTAAITNVNLLLYKNGVEFRDLHLTSGSTTIFTSVGGSTSLELWPADYIEIFVTTGGAAFAMSVGSAVTNFFDGFLISHI